MKAKHVPIVLVAIAVVGFAALLVVNFHPSTGNKTGASAFRTNAREMATAARFIIRDLLGRERGLPQTTKQTLEWVPFGSPLETARQTMTDHQFSCTVDSYTNPAQLANRAIWNTPFVKDGQSLPVTNVARLTCKTNGCTLTFWVVNGETRSLAAEGKF